MLLAIEQRTKKHKVYAFSMSLFLHVVLFVFFVKTVAVLDSKLFKQQRETEVDLISVPQPKITLPAPLNPPIVKKLVKEVKIHKIIMPAKAKTEMPDIKDIPKKVKVPNIKSVAVDKPIKKIDINEDAVNKVIVPTHPEKYVKSFPLKQYVKVNKAVKPVNVNTPIFPNVSAERNKLANGMYNALIKHYTSLVRGIVEKHKFYPEMAREEGIEGSVFLEFRILRSGKLAFVKILKSSSYDLLDSAAVYSVKAASPFPSIPNKLGKKSLTMKLWIKFKLGG